MTFERRVKLIARLDGLIKRKYRGTATDYARKLEISRAAFFRLLEFIKTDFDAPIEYNKTSGCYEYQKSGVMFFGFLPEAILTQEGLKKLQGGIFSYVNMEKFGRLFLGVSIFETPAKYF
jgi:hypothetical protein